MGTWICHLRVAELIVSRLPELDPGSFYAGSIAPDSGIPNENWTVFDPPKIVTHFLGEKSDQFPIHDLLFFHAYKDGLVQDLSSIDSSFLWGYYFHLLTDALWIELLDPATKTSNAALFAKLGKDAAIDLIKEDWYGLDHLFLRKHPGWPPWEIFLHYSTPDYPIRHIPAQAIHHQFDYIRSYYSDSMGNLDRPYPYLNEQTMQRIVFDSANASIKIFNRITSGASLGSAASGISLLTKTERTPYAAPLGDL